MKGKIFNAQEVQSILNGSKVMFREVIKPQPEFPPIEGQLRFSDREILQIKCPYQVGETIFVKETFALKTKGGHRFNFAPFISYEAASKDFSFMKRVSPVRMKQEHSRLTLRIKSVKVERLADISEEDCLKEGVETFMNFGEIAYIDYSKKHHALYNARESFATLWNSTHKKPEEKWEANPWVFAYEYEVIKNN